MAYSSSEVGVVWVTWLNSHLDVFSECGITVDAVCMDTIGIRRRARARCLVLVGRDRLPCARAHLSEFGLSVRFVREPGECLGVCLRARRGEGRYHRVAKYGGDGGGP